MLGPVGLFSGGPGHVLPLGPMGPFPSAPMRRVLERRWLHYAFLSRDGRLGLVSNIAWLGPPGFWTSILLLHERDRGWTASQYNAETAQPWSAFSRPSEDGRFAVAATDGSVGVDLAVRRTSRPCTSQCAPFAHGQHLRWQSETGVTASGRWTLNGTEHRDVDAIGYHERVRGHWGWPELGGWVFGFANDPAETESGRPATAVVFTLIHPGDPPDAPTASVMLWRDGRMVRHFPRRRVSAAVRGELDENRVARVPAMAAVLGVPPMETIPRRLVIAAGMGGDELVLDFSCDAAARVVVPSETSLRPFSVHEVIGPVTVDGSLSGRAFGFQTRGIVEFAGGAGGD